MRIDPSYPGWNREKLTAALGPQWSTVKVEEVRPGVIVHLTRHNERETPGVPPTEIVGPVVSMYEREEAIFIQVPGCEIVGMPRGAEVQVVLP